MYKDCMCIPIKYSHVQYRSHTHMNKHTKRTFKCTHTNPTSGSSKRRCLIVCEQGVDVAVVAASTPLRPSPSADATSAFIHSVCVNCGGCTLALDRLSVFSVDQSSYTHTNHPHCSLCFATRYYHHRNICIWLINQTFWWMHFSANKVRFSNKLIVHSFTSSAYRIIQNRVLHTKYWFFPNRSSKKTLPLHFPSFLANCIIYWPARAHHTQKHNCEYNTHTHTTNEEDLIAEGEF